MEKEKEGRVQEIERNMVKERMRNGWRKREERELMRRARKNVGRRIR